MPFPVAAVIGAGAGLLGSLFQRDPAKAQAKAQKELMQMEWQRQDAMRPFQTQLATSPVMRQQLGLGQQNNLMNWQALASRMTPQMLALLETVAPQFNVSGQMNMGSVGRQPGGNSGMFPGGNFGGSPGNSFGNNFVPNGRPMGLPSPYQGQQYQDGQYQTPQMVPPMMNQASQPPYGEQFQNWASLMNRGQRNPMGNMGY